jgi:Carboxypeptidase regulatory-like domain
MDAETRFGRFLKAALLPVFVLAMAMPAVAQTLTGSLSGLVVDTSEGVLPGATVTLVNELSGDQRTTVTNEAGNFVFAAVQAGTYSIKVELSGFQPVETKGIVLRLGEKRNLTGIKLGVAGLSEQVAVTATTELAPVSSGEKSVSIGAEQIQNTAIVGRSAAELLKILPGMAPTGGTSSGAPGFNGEVYGINGNGEGGKQSAIGNYSSNGTGNNALDIVIDGAHGSDPGCNCATSVNPNPDMVEEFKVLQANFGAENAKGPTTINVVSKAGGREFRGTAYTYLRHYDMNANEWFLNKVDDSASGPQNQPKNKFYFPGFNIGGPLIIPGTDFNKNRDKLFFFFGYEYYKQDLDTGTLKSWVPTQAMRNGDFSDAGYLGLLGTSGVNKQPFASNGGHVPGNLIDPNGQILLNLLPLPNINPGQANGYNYVQNVPLSQNNQQALGRVDVSVSDNTKLFFRYNFQAETQPFPVGLWWRAGGTTQVPYPTSVVADNRSHSSTASLTKVFGSTLTSETTFGLTYINFPNAFEDPSKVSKAALGYTNPGVFKNGLDQIPSFETWGNGPTIFNPGGFDPVLFARKWLVSIAQNVTKVSGEHTIKGGFYYEWVDNSQPGNGNSNGHLVLNPGATDSSGQLFSTGNVFSDLLTGRLQQFDDATKNVLHNEAYHLGEFYVQDSWKVRPRITIEGGLRVSHLGNWYDAEGIGMAVFDSSLYNPNASIADLSGLTYNKIDSSVPLSGAKSKYLFYAPRAGFAWDIQGTGQTLLRGGYGVFNYHDDQGPFAGSLDVPAGFKSTTVCCSVLLADVPNVTPGVAKIGITALDRNDDQQPRAQSWSVTVQRRLPWSVTVETGYVGSKSDRLRNDGVSNINTVPFGAMLNNPGGNPDDYRPFKLWQSIGLVEHNLYSNYHSWQTLVSRQTGKFSFTGAYTFSKALGIRAGGGLTGRQIQPPDNNQVRQYLYGVLGNDRRHLLSFAYSWLLPEVKTGVTNAILGNWQISGISQFISGVPLQVVGGDGNLRIDGTNEQGVSLTSNNITGSPDMQLMPVLTCDPRGSGDVLVKAECFAAPSVGNPGNYAWPNIEGPWFVQHDLSLFKNVPFGANRKFQFRVSAYNVFNHPQRTPEDAVNLNLDFANGAQTNQKFGLLPTDNKYGHRLLQLAFKFYF